MLPRVAQQLEVPGAAEQAAAKQASPVPPLSTIERHRRNRSPTSEAKSVPDPGRAAAAEKLAAKPTRPPLRLLHAHVRGVTIPINVGQGTQVSVCGACEQGRTRRAHTCGACASHMQHKALDHTFD
jgi:hypothetical protein